MRLFNKTKLLREKIVKLEKEIQILKEDLKLIQSMTQAVKAEMHQLFLLRSDMRKVKLMLNIENQEK